MDATALKNIGLGILLLKGASGGVNLGEIARAAAPAVLSGLSAQKLDWKRVALSAGALWFIWKDDEARNGTRLNGAKKIPVADLDDRVKILADFIKESRELSEIRELAGGILRQAAIAGKDWHNEIDAIFTWVQRNIRYTRDTISADTYQKPLKTLEMRIGDCDDMTTLLGALYGSVGYPVRIKVIAAGGSDWDHVYPLVGYPPYNPQRWIAADASIEAGLGYEVAAKKQKIYGVE